MQNNIPTVQNTQSGQYMPIHSHERSKGALIGASAGSLLAPGAGTVIGGAIGAIVGHGKRKQHMQENTHRMD